MKKNYVCINKCLCAFSVSVSLSFFCLLLLTWIGLAGLGWLLHLVWCAPLSFALPYAPLPLLVFWQASVNCPLPMVKLLQTPRCYDDWRHLWVAPLMKLRQPWPEWELKTHSTPAKPTSMYLTYTDMYAYHLYTLHLDTNESPFLIHIDNVILII